MLMRTPARERPRFGERPPRTIDRLRAFLTSLATSATTRKPAYQIVEEEPEDSNVDVAFAALIDSIESPVKPAGPRAPSMARITTSKDAPHISVYERPPYFAVEPQQRAADATSGQTAPEDELSELRKELMHAISARLGSPEDHLATIRSLIRSVK